MLGRCNGKPRSEGFDLIAASKYSEIERGYKA